MTRRSILAGFGACAVAVIMASLAWACSPLAATPVLENPRPQASPAGERVTVAGRQWVPGVDVEVHLDAVAGPVLAVAPVRNDGTFQVDVVIPAVAPGGHYLVAVQGAAWKSTPIEVAASGAVGAPAPPVVTPIPPSTAPPTPVTAQQVSGGAASPALPQPAPTAPVATSPAPAPAPAAAQPAPAPAPGPAPAAAPVAGQPATAPAAVATSPAPEAAGATPASPGPGLPVATTTPSTAPPARFNVSSGDLWSGFSSLGRFEGASLLDLPSERASERRSSPLPVGAVALAAGMAALLAGFAGTELLRRRAPAS